MWWCAQDTQGGEISPYLKSAACIESTGGVRAAGIYRARLRCVEPSHTAATP